MMFEDTYKILVGEGDGLYKEKGSKFIAKAFAVHSEEDVKARVAEFKKQYFDARHHCYAFIINPDKSCYRSADDGHGIAWRGLGTTERQHSVGQHSSHRHAARD